MSPALEGGVPRAKNFKGVRGVHKWRDGITCGNSTDSSDSHLEIDLSGLINVILIVLSTVNLQFKVGLFPFFESISQDCGSLCHGYSLVIM